MLSNNNLLLRALRMNAIFSAFSAVLMFVAGNWLAEQFALKSPVPVYAVGAFLGLFSLQLANVVRTRHIREWEVKGIISGDIAWVIASLGLVGIYYESISATAVMLVDIVAVVVLYFAIRQIRGLRAYRAIAASH
jgi:hypothetical protein